MKSAFKIFPRGLRGLLDYLSPSAFDVVGWQKVARDAPKLSRRILLKAGAADVQASLKLPEGIRFADAQGHAPDPKNPKKTGETLLALYFSQIYQDGPMFLDLRQERFSFGDRELLWHPGGLWVDLGADFKRGMRQLYDGFYLGDQAAMESGLSLLGLTPEGMALEAKDELKELLDDHFGAGREKPIKFELANFVASFDRLFQFLKNHRVHLSGDFLYLGIYLVTLYLHLEALGASYDVGRAFKRGEASTKHP